MKVSRERETNGLIIESENVADNEVLTYLWCNKPKLVEFSKRDGLCSLVIAPEDEASK